MSGGDAALYQIALSFDHLLLVTISNTSSAGVNQYLRQITKMFYSLNTAVFKKQQRESITN